MEVGAKKDWFAEVAMRLLIGIRTDGLGFGDIILLTMMSSGSLGTPETSKDSGIRLFDSLCEMAVPEI
jgi:hypothetical protein